MVYTFTKTAVWTEFHHVKQDVLLEISAIIALHGSEIAFPTQTLNVATVPGTLSPSSDVPYSTLVPARILISARTCPSSRRGSRLW